MVVFRVTSIITGICNCVACCGFVLPILGGVNNVCSRGLTSMTMKYLHM